ncbi:hypothetical protein GR184_11415 [Bacillus sp. BGMRC0062]|nr:hypothetical protein [Bacillus sp. BGMRC0062]
MSEESSEELTTAPSAESTSDEVAFWALERLRSDVDGVKAGLGSLVDVVAGLQEQSAPHEGEGPEAPAPVWWSWCHVTGDKRRELWGHLIDFVEWVNARYFPDKPSTAIPACWFEHGMVVEELTGVWAAWHGALHGAKEPTNDYAAWHRYYFWPAMERITQATKECQGTKGHEAMVRRPVREHPGLEAFMDADCSAHPDPEEAAGETVDFKTGEIGDTEDKDQE